MALPAFALLGAAAAERRGQLSIGRPGQVDVEGPRQSRARASSSAAARLIGAWVERVWSNNAAATTAGTRISIRTSSPGVSGSRLCRGRSVRAGGTATAALSGSPTRLRFPVTASPAPARSLRAGAPLLAGGGWSVRPRVGDTRSPGRHGQKPVTHDHADAAADP